MDVLDLVDLERVGLADGREESLFGDAPKKAEHYVGGLDWIFTLGLGVLEEDLDLRAQSGHQLVDPLELRSGRAQEKPFPMGGEFRLLVFFEQPRVDGDAAAPDEDLDRVRQGQDLRERPGIGRRHRVAVGLKLHEGGLRSGGRDAAIRPGVDLGKRPQLLFVEHFGGRALGRSVEAEVALFLPGEDLGVELLQALDGGDAEERLQVPDNSFDAAFFVGPAHVTGVDRKSVMPRKIQERRVVVRLGISL